MSGPWDKYRQQGIPVGAQDPAAQYRAPAAATGIQAQQSNMETDAVRRAQIQQQMAIQQQLAEAQRREALAQAALKEQQAKVGQAEVANKDPFNAQQLASAQDDAIEKLRTIDRIGKNHAGAILPSIGTGSETVRYWLSGSNAANIAADVDALKAGGALTEIMKMTQATGKNPFTPMSNNDVEIIARNKGNLTQHQAPENFFANLKPYKDAYTRAYAGAVGMQTLNSEIERLLPTIPAGKREQFKADALKRYNQAMARKGGLLGSSSRGKTKATNGSFLGWED